MNSNGFPIPPQAGFYPPPWPVDGFFYKAITFYFAINPYALAGIIENERKFITIQLISTATGII